MDVYKAMASRRTIRDFSTREVCPEIIRKIISAGMQAPSNNHLRQWHFILLQDRARRKALIDQVLKPVTPEGALEMVNHMGLTDPIQREMYLEAIPKQHDMLMNSTCLIVPCFWQHVPLLKPKTLSDLNYFASVWACIENILVAAAAEGILGVIRIPFEIERRTMKELLHLPDDYEIPCWMALGYPAENISISQQVSVRLEDHIHIDLWEHDLEATTLFN